MLSDRAHRHERRPISTPDTGATLELRQEIGGWRDYLDGHPVHCGDQLLLLTDTGWIWARYEADLRPGSDAAG